MPLLDHYRPPLYPRRSIPATGGMAFTMPGRPISAPAESSVHG
ncbi:MAG: hypothetical protein R3C14_07150 [Caldilineaceae bacterium]